MILVLRVIFVSRYLLYGMLLCMLYNVSVLWDIWFLEVMLLSYGIQILKRNMNLPLQISQTKYKPAD